MSCPESKVRLLSSVISGELKSTRRKMDYWQLDNHQCGVLWQSTAPVSLEEALSTIDPESDEIINSRDLSLLYGIGWEFVWGQVPPQVVQKLREEVIIKARYGLELEELEKLWYSLILIDTDTF